MKNPVTRSIIVVALATCASTAALAADFERSSDSENIVRSLTVDYEDLRLEADAGVNALYTRLEKAAKRVCGRADSRNLAAQRDMRQCRADALHEAVTAIDDARLTRVYRVDHNLPLDSAVASAD